MRLYLDTEYNGHGGELISLALAAEDGKHWYGFWGMPAPIDGWVAEHVIPNLQVDGVYPCNLRALGWIPDRPLFRASLREYLSARGFCTIYADWPDDFAHLMRVMSGAYYEQSWLVPCSMVLLKESEPKPDHPHNALSDAIALLKWHRDACEGKVLSTKHAQPEAAQSAVVSSEAPPPG